MVFRLHIVSKTLVSLLCSCMAALRIFAPGRGQVPAVGAGYRAVAYSRRYARPNGDIEAGFGRHSGDIGRGNVAMRKKPYTVMVDDNFHYMDEEHRTKHGAYATFEKAVTACKKIVDEDLRDMLKQGVTPEDLSSTWSMYGSDPYIVGGSRRFSARDYVGEKTRST